MNEFENHINYLRRNVEFCNELLQHSVSETLQTLPYGLNSMTADEKLAVVLSLGIIMICNIYNYI